MNILWVNANFLHPTTKGGQIRTLEMLRRLRQCHQIHYAAFENPREPEGLARSSEYCHRACPVPLGLPARSSPAFAWALLRGLGSPLPVSLRTRLSARMRAAVSALVAENHYDALVCDFLTPAINLPGLEHWVLFQHNIETMIWRRAAARARDPLRKTYLSLQARRMFQVERAICRNVRHVIAVSGADARLMRKMFGLAAVSSVPTGVDVNYFAPPPSPAPSADLVFVGSMDWLANIDGVTWFLDAVLPLIRARRPACSVAIVGRTPPSQLRRRAARDPLLTVTGTVPDVRPYLWGAPVSIVPLRIGGGTRLKIYEAMAAGSAVVSTTVGAEGLDVHPGIDIRIGDSAAEFAAHCLELLSDCATRDDVAAAARRLVCERFSWETVATRFEEILSAVTEPSYTHA